MTSVNMLPADDPASVEAFLRVRESQLLGGRYAVRGTREAAEQRSDEHDGERLLRALRSIRRAAQDPRVLASRLADDADERAELRRAGWTDERIDRAAAALRDNLQWRVHPLSRPSLTAGGGPGGNGRPQSRPPSGVAPRIGRRPDMVARHIAAARAAGIDPVQMWPTSGGCCERRSNAAARPPIPGTGPPVSALLAL